MALEPRRRFTTFANKTADRILKFEGNKIAKAAVLVWLVFSSVFTPLYTWNKERQQAAREGLTESPRVMLSVDEAGRCHVVNRSARALVHVELRRFLHSFEPNVGCVPEKGALPYAAPIAKSSALSAGDSLVEPFATRSPREELSQSVPCNGATPCVRLLECEVNFHRSADLRPFDHVGFAGITQDSQIEFPIFDTPTRTPKWGGGAKYTFSVKEKWKRPFECAHNTRRLRRSMYGFFEQILDGTGQMMQSK
jgi:hypothetical protein